MTTSDYYVITQYPTRNEIVITLPQRWDTLTNTLVPVSDRRMTLTDAEEGILLALVKAMFENEAKMDDTFEEPAINPCRGCKDYDGRGGCISNGGCGASINEVKE